MRLSASLNKKVDKLVEHYKTHQESFLNNARALEGHFSGDSKMRQIMHSVRYRVKDPEHLRDKIERKIHEKKGVLNLTVGNLFSKINDLAGVRILHLYTRQSEELFDRINEILLEQRYNVIEGPIAHTWDYESKAYFEKLGVTTKARDTMYTSIHYVLKTNTNTPYTCELQVRTLMEEVWGEVSHRINYPHETESVACSEQLKTLARVTSAGTRLVDSLFASEQEFHNHKKVVGILRSRNRA